MTAEPIAEHASAIWQEFDVAMIMPEPYYDQRQYWFKMDTYASNDPGYTPGKAFFCAGCRGTKTQEAFSQASFQCNGNGYPGTCIGCAHIGAIRAQSHLADYQQLLDWQKYSLASAMYAYDQHLQFKDPREDMVAFLKVCAPVAYTGYGKTISHFGGFRVAPHQAIEYAGWGKAKQLAWDRAPNKDGELCYICYYDAGNSVYAGFVRSILTPEDRRELYNGVTDPRE